MLESFADTYDAMPVMRPPLPHERNQAEQNRLDDVKKTIPVPETVSEQVELLSLLYFEF